MRNYRAPLGWERYGRKQEDLANLGQPTCPDIDDEQAVDLLLEKVRQQFGKAAIETIRMMELQEFTARMAAMDEWEEG